MTHSNGKGVKYGGKVFVADLAAHRKGIIHGVWLNPALPFEELRKRIEQMLSESPVGNENYDWALHDYSGPNPYFLGDLANIKTIHEKAVLEAQSIELLDVLTEHFHGDYDVALDFLTDNYCGDFETLADYARDMMESTGAIDKDLAYFVDYEKMAKGMLKRKQIFVIYLHDKVHVFNAD